MFKKIYLVINPNQVYTSDDCSANTNTISFVSLSKKKALETLAKRPENFELVTLKLNTELDGHYKLIYTVILLDNGEIEVSERYDIFKGVDDYWIDNTRYRFDLLEKDKVAHLFKYNRAFVCQTTAESKEKAIEFAEALRKNNYKCIPNYIQSEFNPYACRKPGVHSIKTREKNKNHYLHNYLDTFQVDGTIKSVCRYCGHVGE